MFKVLSLVLKNVGLAQYNQQANLAPTLRIFSNIFSVNYK